jgi:hypothetical protein
MTHKQTPERKALQRQYEKKRREKSAMELASTGRSHRQTKLREYERKRLASAEYREKKKRYMKDKRQRARDAAQVEAHQNVEAGQGDAEIAEEVQGADEGNAAVVEPARESCRRGDLSAASEASVAEAASDEDDASLKKDLARMARAVPFSWRGLSSIHSRSE